MRAEGASFGSESTIEGCELSELQQEKMRNRQVAVLVCSGRCCGAEPRRVEAGGVKRGRC